MRHEVDAEKLALLEEDLRSPCTEEVAVFHAFSKVISQAHNRFVVIDTAPTGHTLLLLDATGAYHKEIMRSFAAQGKEAHVTTPMMKLQDPDYTKILIVTLAETTPIQEATELQSDLARADIKPYGWIINNSLADTETADPLLKCRARNEVQLLAQIVGHATRNYIIPWQVTAPIGI